VFKNVKRFQNGVLKQAATSGNKRQQAAKNG
jgi:hypothetical protein